MAQYAKPLNPFVVFCQKTIPLAFDESMSYMEALYALKAYLEEQIIPTVNTNAQAVDDLTNLYNELHDYVEHYFDNLDVQEEINHKLDEMAEDGTLADIIAEYVQLRAILSYDSVADMMSAENLTDGSYVETYGFHNVGDNGGAKYIVREIRNTDVVDGVSIIALSDPDLVAELLPDENFNAKQFGAYGDGEHDDYLAIQKAIDFCLNKGNSVFLPEGTYNVSRALIIPQFVELRGETKNNTKIVKTVNETNNDFDVDAIIIFEQTADYEFTYNQSQSVKKLNLVGNDTTTYGIYAEKAVPRTSVEDCIIEHVATCIYYKAGGWLFSVKNCALRPVSNGIWINDTSTTLDLDRTYVYGGNGYGYYLRGVTYSSLSNIACDENTNIAYYFWFCNLVVNGIGCECPANKKFIYANESKLIINSGTVIASTSDADYIAVEGYSSNIAMSDVSFIPYNGGASFAGKFLHSGTDCCVEFNDCKCSVPFLTANHYTSTYTTEKVKTNTSNVIVNGINEQSGLGKLTNDTHDTFATNTKLIENIGAVIFNNRGDIRYSMSGYDRRWRPSHNLGDIYVNQAPALNGIAMFQQTSDSQNRNFTGTISATNISGSSGTITLTSLTLDVDSWGIKVDNQHSIQSSSGGTASISAVDTGTSTLTLSSVSGTFAVGDTLIYKGKTNIDNTTTSKIQSIGYGTTSQRPANPVNGYMYWDTSLGKPIWRSGSAWKDASGNTVS